MHVCVFVCVCACVCVRVCVRACVRVCACCVLKEYTYHSVHIVKHSAFQDEVGVETPFIRKGVSHTLSFQSTPD